jgi:hypothetical protein
MTQYKTIQEASKAAISLGLNSFAEYKTGYKQDVRLPANPNIKYSADWIDFGRWHGFLGYEKKVFYLTIQEASKAAIALGLSTREQYMAGYKQDSRLLANPNRLYSADWIDFGRWHGFLGTAKKDFYPTIEKASKAVIGLGLNSIAEYKAGYKQDARLPSKPSKLYSADWADFGKWYGFLGKEKKDYYPRIQEASKAAIALGLNSIAEYKAGYKQDARLSAHPNELYSADWLGFDRWYGFLGNDKKNFYPTIQEASKAAITLGLNSVAQYKSGYKQDTLLPESPKKLYSGDWVGFGAWYGFLGKEKKDFYPTIQEASKAAIALGLSTREQYMAGYKQDARLTVYPNKRYRDDWVGFGRWYGFLGNEKKYFYSTIEEASKAAITLGLNSIAEYKTGYKQDARLTTTPDMLYRDDWIGFGKWRGFLGNEVKDFYLTIQEASKAAIALGLSSEAKYVAGYKQDARLTSSPNMLYRDDWKGFGKWRGFLGNEKKDFYPTIQEASKAAIALGFSSEAKYRAGYKQDARLPGSPHALYSADWEDFDRWYGFLGNEKKDFYPTIQEASKATIALGFSTLEQYRAGYKQDAKLPACPNKLYSADWEGFDRWDGFFGNEKSKISRDDITELHVKWGNIFDLYIDEQQRNITAKKRTALSFIVNFIIKYGYPLLPEEFLLRSTKLDKQQYEYFLENNFPKNYASTHHVMIKSFLQYALNKLCTLEDEDEKTIHHDFRNPVATFESHILKIKPERLDESDKPALAYTHVVAAREWIIPIEAKDFNDLKSLHDVTTRDWFEVDPSLIDESDSDCVYRIAKVEKRGIDGTRTSKKVTQIWSPVRFLATYSLLTIPARGQQLLWCDSGEADNRIPNMVNGKVEFSANTSSLVQSKARKKKEQGFIKEYDDNEIGLRFTTNKTSRTEGGYSIPWCPDGYDYWMIKLRNWQSKYNPLSDLTKWSDIPLRQTVGDKILKLRGSNCFLFRQMNSSFPYLPSILTSSIPYVLHQIETSDNPLTTKKAKNDGLLSYSTIYTPHSMRVSLVTAFVVDAKVPVHIVQKLVGHARLVMTIYYTKVGLAEIRDELSEAHKRSLANSSIRLEQELRNANVEKIKNELVGNDLIYLDSLSDNHPTSAFSFSDIGICPLGGGRCEHGGECVDPKAKKKKYLPVPVGHLGVKNCPRCRFFITSPSYTGGLMAVQNEIALKQTKIEKKLNILLSTIKKLKKERYVNDRNGDVFTKATDLQKTETHLELISEEKNMYLGDMISLIRLITQCIALSNELANNETTSENALIVNSTEAELNWSLDEAAGEFHQLSAVCENSTIYTLTDGSDAAVRRTQLIDKMAYLNGIDSRIYMLSPEQQLVVGNQFSTLLKDRLKSWGNVEKVMSNEVYLSDLTGDDQLQQIQGKVKELLLGNSVKLSVDNTGLEET